MLCFDLLLRFFFFLLYWIIVFFIIVHIFFKKKPICFLLSWFFICYMIPFFGFFLYLLFNDLFVDKCKTEKKRNIKILLNVYLKRLKKFNNFFYDKKGKFFKNLLNLYKKVQGLKRIHGNKIRLLTNYKDSLYSIIKNIDSALYNIEMVFYVWKPGGLVDKVTESLINAAKRGIKCRIMIDSIGSWSFFNTNYPKIMREAGIELIEFRKINFFYFFFYRIDCRQHKKIIIIDGFISYVGSMNMFDPNVIKKQSKFGKWIDILIEIRGPASTILRIIYFFDWSVETNQQIFPSISNLEFLSYKYNFYSSLQIISSGPGFKKGLIKKSIITAIFSAKKKIIFTTPYFVPSDDLIQAICMACMRGVKVFIIVPDKNNSFLVHWASRVFYSKLLKYGVKIYQFNGGFLHTKSISIDGKLSFVGSVNLDIRSLWLNFEIFVLIDDNKFSRKLILLQHNYISQSVPIVLKKWKNRPKWNRLIEYICYLFRPLL